MVEKVINFHMENMFFLFWIYVSIRMTIFFWRQGYKYNAFIALYALTMTLKLLSGYAKAIFEIHWPLYIPIIFFFVILLIKFIYFLEKSKSSEEMKAIRMRLLFVSFEMVVVFFLMFWWSKYIGRDFF